MRWVLLFFKLIDMIKNNFIFPEMTEKAFLFTRHENNSDRLEARGDFYVREGKEMSADLMTCGYGYKVNILLRNGVRKGWCYVGGYTGESSFVRKR